MKSITKKLKGEQEGARKYNQLENLVYANIKEAQHIATCKMILRYLKKNCTDKECCEQSTCVVEMDLMIWLEGEIENGKD